MLPFHITLDENGEYAFDTTDFTLDRFKADVYGQAKIDDLSKEEAKASADQDDRRFVSGRPLWTCK